MKKDEVVRSRKEEKRRENEEFQMKKGKEKRRRNNERGEMKIEKVLNNKYNMFLTDTNF